MLYGPIDTQPWIAWLFVSMVCFSTVYYAPSMVFCCDFPLNSRNCEVSDRLADVDWRLRSRQVVILWRLLFVWTQKHWLKLKQQDICTLQLLLTTWTGLIFLRFILYLLYVSFIHFQKASFKFRAKVRDYSTKHRACKESADLRQMHLRVSRQ